MAFKRYEFTLCIEVSDESALIQAAIARAEEEGCCADDVIGPMGALTWLLDNNEVLRGWGAQITDSYCEEVMSCGS